ncbi:MAG: FecR domain-containing protein [Myxococcota bacterium]|nr:FecR domain-containing protein [Myxococcota bacterium]
MKTQLDRAIHDAREHLGKRETQLVAWHDVERRVFARIAEAQRAERATLLSSHGRTWMALGLGVAVSASGVFLAMQSRNEPLPFDAARVASSDLAGTITSAGADVLVNGRAAPAGLSVHLGDWIETRGASATLDRPGKLSLVLERGSRATVTHVAGALVLALAEGTVEAQVVPVAGGEAFAVDVGPSRVAVHGTHLRVAHSGDRVLVDLSEGAITIGEAPRVGSELGAVLSAPAHAEFDANSARTTLEVRHEGFAARATSVALDTPERASAPGTAATPPRTDRADPRGGPATVPVRMDAGGASTASAPPGPATAEWTPEAAIASAVRACMPDRPRAQNVTVLVTTTLRLELFEDGTVRSARFDPPVASDVNTCAAASIYRVRFASRTSVSIPIELTK